MFSIATHNGFITMRSLKTGDHRTFRVWTQDDAAEFMPGRRLVGLLSGSDNENDYRSFGVLDADGRGIVHLWRKHQGQAFYEWAKSALQNPELHGHQVEINFDARCRVCDRLLTTPESVASGIGPTCAKRMEAKFFELLEV